MKLDRLVQLEKALEGKQTELAIQVQTRII